MTPAEDDQLWDSGTIGSLRFCCVVCSTMLAQFIRGYNPDSYTYIENGSKNHKCTFGNSKDFNKVVTILATEDNPPPKCVIS